MTLPNGTGTRTRTRVSSRTGRTGVDTGAARSTLRAPDASLTATVTGEGA